jgi:hypothetical protein
VVGRPDSQLGSTITAVTFLVMGVPALLLGLWSAFRGLTGRRDERPAATAGGAGLGALATAMSRFTPRATSSPSAAGARSPGGDQIGKIERLQKLRESGAITDSEFEREKAKILGS